MLLGGNIEPSQTTPQYYTPKTLIRARKSLLFEQGQFLIDNTYFIVIVNQSDEPC